MQSASNELHGIECHRGSVSRKCRVALDVHVRQPPVRPHRREQALRLVVQGFETFHGNDAQAELAEQGLAEWTRGLPEEDTEALVDNNAGTPIRWISGEGWVEGCE